LLCPNVKDERLVPFDLSRLSCLGEAQNRWAEATLIIGGKKCPLPNSDVQPEPMSCRAVYDPSRTFPGSLIPQFSRFQGSSLKFYLIIDKYLID
jgi:hypothetical protein